MTYDNENNQNAVYALNSYIWKLLEANLGWDKADYTNRTPIIPVSQQPEFLQTARPFLVYGSALHPAEHLYSLKKEAVSYMIYSKSATEVNRIVDLLNETFARQDDAAEDVNNWLAVEGTPGNRATARRVHFGTIRAIMAEKAEDAPESEGGYAAGLVLVEAKYTVDDSNIITSGFTYP
jgi:hypothetical protein